MGELKLKLDRNAMLLYIVTDRTWLGENSLENQVEDTLSAGATLIQLREKDMSYEEFVQEAKKIKQITDKYKVPLIINDNINVALAVNADGVHVGQSDMDAKDVRKLIGMDKILGVSAQTVEQAIKAEKSGADYIGVGAVFTTSTKEDADSVSFETLKAICSSISIPVVAIGGINERNIMQLKGTGIDGVAVISAIFAKPDIYQATGDLLKLSREMVGKGVVK
jgi:thiamine-phosphate pyrophosphorylase